jgi:hypothetical protein
MSKSFDYLMRQISQLLMGVSMVLSEEFRRRVGKLA